MTANDGTTRPPPRILMGPGPSSVDPRVLSAMSQPVLGHLDPALLGMMDDLKAMLRRLFRTSNEMTLAVTGTGTAGMECAVSNLVEPGDRVIVGIAGYFGARMAEMVRRCGGEPITVETDWGTPVPAGRIEEALRSATGSGRRVKAVCIVHAETSTGVLQPLQEIAAAARGRDALLVVDAVTSLGGIPLDVDATGIDVCYSGTQKCLGAPPGMAPITVGPRAVEAMRSRRAPSVSFNFDLGLLDRYWGRERVYHHTISASAVYALHEALRLIEEEGLEERFARHRRVHERLRAGAEGLGVDFLVPEESRLPVLNALRVPEGVDERAVRVRLLTEHNIEIGAGLGPLAGKVWRVGTMGYSAREENVARFLTAMRIILGAGRMSRPSTRRPSSPGPSA